MSTATTITASPLAALPWDELDRRTVDVARALAMDAVESAGSGHPGTAMSLAPAAHLLFSRYLRHDPTDPAWPGRDRFVLSCGHTSITLYTQLYLTGYGLTLDDLAHLRQWGSLTPGHPEHGHTPGVETTTGPLGQGVANAVGMAMAARRERGLLDPDAEPGESPFDHTIWAFCSDGDLEEGISSEASSLAGTQQLGNLVLLWDDNRISIEDNTSIAFTEDVAARYEAYGWHVQTVSFVQDDGSYDEDGQALAVAFDAARAERDRPSFIQLRTIIGWPAPNKQNSYKAHGSALGAEEVAATKEILGLDPSKTFQVPDDVLQHARSVVQRGQELRHRWEQGYDAWASEHPDGKALHERLKERRLPAGWTDALPTFEPGGEGAPASMATRKASGSVLTALAPVLPELWGGSADLAESNNTTMEGEPSFLPTARGSKMFPGDPYGRTLHFGVREHAMAGTMNGIALHGGLRVYGGTFLVFSDYMRGSVRLAAVMGLPVTYVWTHDSIGLGEDGPTHQPIEQLAALRAIPGLDVVRPADANEVVIAWRTILEQTDRPAGICLTRQNVPTFDRSVFAGPEGVTRGGYVLRDASSGVPEVILIGTGSEVQIAVAAQERLEAEGVPTRVVSMPCMEWFRAQDEAYKRTVLPPDVRARVSVEAGISQPWYEWVGEAGTCVSIEHFGASAPYTVLYDQFGFTAERVVAAARASQSKLGMSRGSTTGN
jgi:transketolase